MWVEKIQRHYCRVWAWSHKNALLSKLLRAFKKRFNEPCKCNTEILSTLSRSLGRLGNLGFRQKEKQTFKFFLIISTLTKQTNLFGLYYRRVWLWGGGHYIRQFFCEWMNSPFHLKVLHSSHKLWNNESGLTQAITILTWVLNH